MKNKKYLTKYFLKDNKLFKKEPGKVAKKLCSMDGLLAGEAELIIRLLNSNIPE